MDPSFFVCACILGMHATRVSRLNWLGTAPESHGLGLRLSAHVGRARVNRGKRAFRVFHEAGGLPSCSPSCAPDQLHNTVCDSDGECPCPQPELRKRSAGGLVVLMVAVASEVANSIEEKFLVRNIPVLFLTGLPVFPTCQLAHW